MARRGRRSNGAAHFGRAGKGNLVHVWMLHKRFAG
jgi:hypothetical protein